MFNQMLNLALAARRERTVTDLKTKGKSMRVLFSLRYGLAIECGSAVISLGWNVWGLDCGLDRYCIAHVWRPRLFYRWR